ncbi:hypothetical protein EG68_03925 [Paragonimus skrjabini miyazakii]|uniref:Uncharacterized protein n=1 Tax=Paragonimus skrjabini miyazakii TaxID=59628 RepID=A0A8S9Z606_9TREM|nr:hypothetical protein EG68_03925 [Paragonimus skrjabini miyazakii]
MGEALGTARTYAAAWNATRSSLGLWLSVILDRSQLIVIRTMTGDNLTLSTSTALRLRCSVVIATPHRGSGGFTRTGVLGKWIRDLLLCPVGRVLMLFHLICLYRALISSYHVVLLG